MRETQDKKTAPQPRKKKPPKTNPTSLGGSDLPATGEAPLPSQTGKDRPFGDLETHPHSLQMNGAQPQPSVVPQENPTPSAAPQPTLQPPPLTAAEEFAMLMPRPNTPALPSLPPH